MKTKKHSVEIMKILSDPRRERILHLASDQPVTVKYMADQLNEDPLRLYYHVKLLLKADLLEVAETKQQGNLVEKYYKSINFLDTIYQSDLSDQAEHIEGTLATIHHLLDPALQLYKKSLEEVREEQEGGQSPSKMPYHVTVNSGTDQLTTKEWRKSLEKMMKTIAGQADDEPWEVEASFNDYGEEKGTYQTIVISYRIEDAEKAKVIREDQEDGEE